MRNILMFKITTHSL